MSRVDEAFEAIRAHLHERPYDANPSQVYGDMGALSQLLSALSELTRGMAGASKQATASDDGVLGSRREGIALSLFRTRGEINQARKDLDEAHIHVGHLIFPVREDA